MTKAAKVSKIPTEKLALYEQLIASDPKIERKGDVHPYTSLNRHMFTYLDQNGTLGMRLPAGEVEAFLKKYKTKMFESYGVVKKDWVTVPEALLKNPMRGDVKRKNLSPLPWDREAVWLASSPDIDCSEGGLSACRVNFLSMTKPVVCFVSSWFHVAMVVRRPRFAKLRKQKCWLQTKCQP